MWAVTTTAAKVIAQRVTIAVATNSVSISCCSSIIINDSNVSKHYIGSNRINRIKNSSNEISFIIVSCSVQVKMMNTKIQRQTKWKWRRRKKEERHQKSDRDKRHVTAAVKREGERERERESERERGGSIGFFCGFPCSPAARPMIR